MSLIRPLDMLFYLHLEWRLLVCFVVALSFLQNLMCSQHLL